MKKVAYKLSALILILVSLNSCCTKKDCGGVNYPEIKIEYFGLDNKGLDLFTIDKSSGRIVDSIHYYVNMFRIHHTDEHNDLRKFQYIVRLNNDRIDTIKDISYDIYDYYHDCNTCFLAEGGSMVTTYKNLKVIINDETYNQTMINIDINE